MVIGSQNDTVPLHTDARIPELIVYDKGKVGQATVIEYRKGQIMSDFITLKKQPPMNFRPLSRNQRKKSCFQLQST